jgi:hypothetical protein
VSGVSIGLLCELLTQSLAAWGASGRVEQIGSEAVIIGGTRGIHIEPAGSSVFRWMVTIDGRTRGAISLLAVLRQVRRALDPDYAASRVRVAVAPLVPS